MKHLVQKVKTITADDLKNTDHVGLSHDDGDRGFIIFASSGYMPVPANRNDSQTNLGVCNAAYCAGKTYPSLSEAVKSISSSNGIYLFDTRKELYEWLAE